MADGIQSLDPAQLPAGKRARAEAVATEFEQIFVQQMVQGMRKMVPNSDGGGMFGKGPGSGTYEDWFDMHMSNHVSRQGNIGLADHLLRTWERMGQIPPRNTATPDVARAGERRSIDVTT